MIFPTLLIVLGTIFFALRDVSHSLPVIGAILYIMAGSLAGKLPKPKNTKPGPVESPRMVEARRRRELIRKTRERS